MLFKGLLFFSLFMSLAEAAPSNRSVMAFDLGKTLVEHTDFVHQDQAFRQLWYIPGTEEYLTSLRNAGYTIMLIVNVPDAWGGPKGLPSEERQQIKIETLKNSVALSWGRTPKNPPGSQFSWDLIDEIVLPLADHDRKKTGNLDIYLRARVIAQEKFGASTLIYQTEDVTEVCEAEQAELLTRRVKTGQNDFFLPLEEIEDFQNRKRSTQPLYNETLNCRFSKK